MKKYILLIIFILALTFNTLKAYNAESCSNELILNDLNSQNLLTYIKENNLKNIDYICSDNICMKIEPTQIERSIKKFITKNLEYLKTKVDETTYTNLTLKGFKITKIILNDC